MNTWKRRWVIVLAAAVILFVGVAWGIPKLLAVWSAPEKISKNELNTHFLTTYEQSRKRFLTYEKTLKNTYEHTEQHAYSIHKEKLTIDTVSADANKKKENLLVITTGMHGIEGYVGTAMLDVFQNQMLSSLDPDTTGLLYVHASNPWGMKHDRRYNENNVDLNRNFVYEWKSFNLASNKKYSDLDRFFEKKTPVGNSTIHELGFAGSLVKEVIRSGTGKIEEALLTGQYNHPKGVYYGGSGDEESTKIVKQLYKNVLGSPYKNIIHVDLHTGYGPRDQMSIFSSINETMTQKEAEKAFHYPLVLTPESDDFYMTNGDNTEYFYKLQKEKYPDKNFYTTTFEFGTLGEDLLGSLKSLRNTIDENRLYWNGEKSGLTAEKIRNRYQEMFYPSEQEWREKAIKDFKQGMEGVLAHQGFLDK
ncbi:M14 family metallopeptidase [Bacillus sp. 1P06AnD]|uniref:M14 family metallopeptidase n=1 Tax=Bacillus sp. 1P06AnD TaxID=3132208 RepID=UPI0039A0A75C